MSSEPLPKLELSHGDRRCPKCKSIGTYEFISGTVCNELGFNDSNGDYYKTTILCNKCGQHEIIEKADSTSFMNDVVYTVWMDSVKAREQAIVQRLKYIKKQSHAAENVIFDCPDQCIRQLTAQQETIKKLIEELEGKR